jgi:hypothetical protein
VVIWKIPLEQHTHDVSSIPSAEQTQILTIFDLVHYTIEEVEGASFYGAMQ